MTTPADKLAESLEQLEELQQQGHVAIRSKDISRVHRERLVKNGFLHEVMKGWYIPSRPDESDGDSTAWYASYWDFCAAYLHHRFGDHWSFSPEQSLLLHAGNWTVPKQLMVRSPKARNNLTKFPHDTSLMEVRAALPSDGHTVTVKDLRLYSLPTALIAAGEKFFTQYPIDARAALTMVSDSSELLPRLLDGGHSVIAGRLAGAFRNVGNARTASDIVEAMRAAGYSVRSNDPFSRSGPQIGMGRTRSPWVQRLQMMWETMRAPVKERFPDAPGLPDDSNAYLDRVEELYVTDAYHSLSIEGFRVSRDLIEKVRSGGWDPEYDEDDRLHRDALAARGYWQAYQVVRKSIARIVAGDDPGSVADDDHGRWYRELFAPSVTAGIIKPSDLAGYRNGPVYIRRSMHVPPTAEAVRDIMPVFFGLLREEEDPGVRVALGHFFFVYIHPYMDGDGRIGRFLMNCCLASGGYPWTVIPLEQRDQYMAALEQASVEHDIIPFADFLGTLVRGGLEGQMVAKAPTK